MRNNPIPGIFVTIAAVIVFVLFVAYARATLGGAHRAPIPANTGLAEAGALKPEESDREMPPRDRSKTISGHSPLPSVAATEGAGAR